MNDCANLPLANRMAKVLPVIVFLSLTAAVCVSYQIQDAVNPRSSVVFISIQNMIRTCRDENAAYKPVINEFVFTFWNAHQCYQTSTTSEYPHMFNTILESMRRCLRPCTRPMNYTLPTIPCSNQTYPNTLSINYQCSEIRQLPLIINATTPPVLTTTSLTTQSEVITQTRLETSSPSPTTTTLVEASTVTQPSPAKPGDDDEHKLVAVDNEDTTGYLTANLSSVVCDRISDLHVLNLKTEINQGYPCPSTLDTGYVEDQLRTNHSHISQPNCSDNTEKVHRLTIYYNCLEKDKEASKADEITPNGEGDAGENNLTLILAIVIPVFVLLLLIIPTIAFIIYKRRNKIKVLLSTRGSVYGRDEGVYNDPSQAFNYSQMNSAYSNEHLDDNAMYQDPALILRPPCVSGMKRQKNSVKSMESDYQDPSTLACTGPPGTPSPIRDALETTHEDPSSASETYADIDAKGTLPRDDQNIYDLPCVVVARQTSTDVPRDQVEDDTADNTVSQPSYTHMIVTDGQMEPHNYAIIRNPKAYRDSQYYDLENEVQLYDSPVYNSTEDIPSSVDAEVSRKDEVF